MRLIDADKVKEYALTEGFYCDTYADKEYTAELIDILFSTVKAIPVEWIKDYVGSGVSDDIFQRNRRFVLNMIEDWEKENEINR